MSDKSMEETIRFISAELNANPDADRIKLIEKASQEFDLNPLQTDFLMNKYVYNK
ncbi:MAG: hypothetical protein V1874_01545 [Spirochaetota bacterium]